MTKQMTTSKMSDLCDGQTVAENMLRRGQIEFMRGSTLTVTSRPATNEEHCHRPSAVAQTDLQSGSIQLSDIPRGTKKDTLILFLENKRKCGGGTVKNMDYSESMQTATVTFEDHHSKCCTSTWWTENDATV